MAKRTIIMDSILIDGNKPHLYDTETSSEFRNRYNSSANKAVLMYYDMWQKGTLNEISEYVMEHTTKDGGKVIHFVIDVDKLGDEGIGRLCTEYPDMADTLKECRGWTPCIYARAIGLVDICYKTYRDGGGDCIGSSWEHPITQTLSTAGTNRLYEMTEKDPVKGCIELLKAVWGEESKLQL